MMVILFILLILLQYNSVKGQPSLSLVLFKSVDPKLGPCSLNTHCVFYEQRGLTQVMSMNCDPDVLLGFTNCVPINGSVVIQYISITFQAYTILDSGLLNLIDLVNFVYLKYQGYYVTPTFEIDEEGLEGIDLEFFKPLSGIEKLTRFKDHAILSLNGGSFDWYYLKKSLNTPDTCNSQAYQNLLTKNGENLLSSFSEINLRNVKYKHKLCQFLFQNLSIDSMSIENSIPEFMDTRGQSRSVNSSIRQVSILNIKKLELNTKVLDPDVFKNINQLSIMGSSVYKIQENIFKNRFTSLQSIILEARNLNGLLHSYAGVAWIKNLNFDRTPINLTISFTATNYTISLESTQEAIQAYYIYGVEVNFLTYGEVSNTNSTSIFPFIHYEFPNEDFCLFYDIPLERMVVINIYEQTNISCTTAWLYRYQHFYKSLKISAWLEPSTIPQDCNFTKYVELCNLTNSQASLYHDDPYFVIYNFNQGLNSAKSVLIDYTYPIFCGFGFITNMLIVLTIVYNYTRRQEIRAQPKNKNQEILMLEEFLYKYILLNSTLNSIYTLMYLLDSVIPCYRYLVPPNSLILNNCLVKNIALDTLGSVIKLMSNFSYLQISVNRFLLVGKDHPEWLIKLSQIKIKTFFIISFLPSCALSSVIYFQNSLFVFQVKGRNLLYTTYYYYNFPFIYDSTTFYSQFFDKINEIPVLSSFILIHDLFSYFLFCLFSLILDAVTVHKLREVLRDKRKVQGKPETSKSRDSERKSIMMVVSSSVTNFLFRAPELLSILFYYIVLVKGIYVFKLLCVTLTGCGTLIDLSKAFYTMSLCFQLFFYVKFNSLFRISFLILVKSCLRIRLSSDKVS